MPFNSKMQGASKLIHALIQGSLGVTALLEICCEVPFNFEMQGASELIYALVHKEEKRQNTFTFSCLPTR